MFKLTLNRFAELTTEKSSTNNCDGLKENLEHQKDLDKEVDVNGKNKVDDCVEEGVDIYFMDDYFTDLKALENSQLG